MILNSKTLKEITGGELIGDFSLNSYSINTQTLKKDDMFIALLGENHDAHNFLQDAITKGAGALLINSSYYAKNKIDFANLLIVEDTQKALVEIAKFIRNNSNNPFVGITGSVGKTTLKDMVAFLLTFVGNVSATYGNYNNHIGLPLSLLNMKESSDFGVFEMGMSSPNEIALLSDILVPNIGVITDISKAHSEFFESEADIAKEKLDIIKAMPKNGIIFINYDNKYYKEHYSTAKKKLKEVYSFSFNNSNANIFIKNITIQMDTFPYSMLIEAQIFNNSVLYNFPSIALHHGVLSILALGIVATLKQDSTELAKQYTKFLITQGRGNITKEVINNKEIILIDDSYNANPKSMKASLLSLLFFKNSNKILVLGDMLELGDSEKHDHEELKDTILKIQPKVIILLGIRMLNLYKILPQKLKKYHFVSYEDAMLQLSKTVEEQDIILIKGSKGSNSYKIVNLIQEGIK